MKSHFSRKRSVRRPASSQVSKIVGESLTNIESLPDELLFGILIHVPPHDIHNGARLVCRKWYHIINSPDFTNANLQHSPPGLLIQYRLGRMHSFFVGMQQGRIKISEVTYELKSYSMGSCNGLLVEVKPNSLGGNPTMYVVNPTTEQRYALPPLPRKLVTYSCAVMAYAAASMEYKMVLTYSSNRMTNLQRCAIFTIGVDKYWRHVHTKHLPISYRELLSSSVLIAGGFIHWTESGETSLLTLNVETEVLTSSPVPQGYEERLKYYLSTGSSLTMLVGCGQLSWELWELNQESGEWMKLLKIDVEAQKCRLQELVLKYYCCRIPHFPFIIFKPVGWLNYGEVLVFHASHPTRFCFLYNVCTQEIDYFELNRNCDFSRFQFQFHRNSLVVV